MSSTTTEKPAAREAVVSLQTEAANLTARQKELAAQHQAQADAIRQRQNEIGLIQAPLNALLQQRVAIIERIATAQVQLARQTVLQGEWLALVDQAVGVRDAAHLLNFVNLWKAYPGAANAARVTAEIEGFISRRQAELGNLEAEIQNYAGTHALEYLLPVGMGGQAPE